MAIPDLNKNEDDNFREDSVFCSLLNQKCMTYVKNVNKYVSVNLKMLMLKYIFYSDLKETKSCHILWFFNSIYLSNLMGYTYNMSNLDYFI